MPGRKRLKKSHDENTCKLCFTSNEDEAMFGKLLKTNSGAIHYFCMLFACGLEQKGEDDEGAYGFLSEDIRKEILRANKLKCTFCGKNTVASACAVSQCRVKYHFNCGLLNNVLFHYFESFPSYCVKHRPSLDERYNNIDNELSCFICLEKFNDQKNDHLKYKVLLTTCCSKFLHIDCVKRQAYNAGLHFIKCPLCNDREHYIECAQHHGIFIPDEDAKWETPQAWIDQESRYEFCDAVLCKCPNEDGRNYVDDDDWEIHVCATCGSYGVHSACLHDDEIDLDHFECPDCLKLSTRIYETVRIEELKHLNEVTSNYQLNEQVNHLTDSMLAEHGNQLKISEQISNQLKDQISNQISNQLNSQMNSSLSSLKESIDSKPNGQLSQ